MIAGMKQAKNPMFRYLDLHHWSQIEIKFNVEGCFLHQKEMKSMSCKNDVSSSDGQSLLVVE